MDGRSNRGQVTIFAVCCKHCKKYFQHPRDLINHKRLEHLEEINKNERPKRLSEDKQKEPKLKRQRLDSANKTENRVSQNKLSTLGSKESIDDYNESGGQCNIEDKSLLENTVSTTEDLRDESAILTTTLPYFTVKQNLWCGSKVENFPIAEPSLKIGCCSMESGRLQTTAEPFVENVANESMEANGKLIVNPVLHIENQTPTQTISQNCKSFHSPTNAEIPKKKLKKIMHERLAHQFKCTNFHKLSSTRVELTNHSCTDNCIAEFDPTSINSGTVFDNISNIGALAGDVNVLVSESNPSNSHKPAHIAAGSYWKEQEISYVPQVTDIPILNQAHQVSKNPILNQAPQVPKNLILNKVPHVAKNLILNQAPKVSKIPILSKAAQFAKNSIENPALQITKCSASSQSPKNAMRPRLSQAHQAAKRPALSQPPRAAMRLHLSQVPQVANQAKRLHTKSSRANTANAQSRTQVACATTSQVAHKPAPRMVLPVPQTHHVSVPIMVLLVHQVPNVETTGQDYLVLMPTQLNLNVQVPVVLTPST